MAPSIRTETSRNIGSIYHRPPKKEEGKTTRQSIVKKSTRANVLPLAHGPLAVRKGINFWFVFR